MAGLGIYHYGARFYSPKLGRFLSADTIVPGAANPQAYNRYSYVLNNPLRYTDPTGHYCVGDDEDCADEGGDGPASTGTGGNNGGGGGGGGGNPHDDDDFDPNPNGITLIDPVDDGTPQWMDSVLANEWTPIATDLVQLGAAAGLAFIFIGVGAAAIGPGLALLAIALGAIATVAMVANLASLDYQADHGLHEVTRDDFNLAVLSNFAAPVVGGIIPETAALKLGREIPKEMEYLSELFLPVISVLTD